MTKEALEMVVGVPADRYMTAKHLIAALFGKHFAQTPGSV
jgi:hypothetical protein